MTHSMMFYSALARDRNATMNYRGMTPEEKREVLTRAVRAKSSKDLGLIVLSLENRVDTREFEL
ncbi:MAG: hypothetical protein PUJ21_00845 [Clostridia bacterium]|nr:hypothetical protein [Clostridia bacterium]MDY6184198.1 hypothetical protein [Eubacteriales bacterium]